jgi:tetratricopeptide (TPR) repeat protein
MKWMLLGLVSTIFLTFGCSQKLRVKSDPPDAEVYVRAVGKKDKTFLGRTPLEISTSEFKSKSHQDISDGSYVELVFEKKDFMTEKLLLPATRFNTLSTEVFTKLRGGVEESSFASQMVHHLQHAQSFVDQNDLDRALNELDQALAYDDHFAMALSLKGSVLYLQKRYSESLSYFEKALKYDERLDEAVRMIGKIKRERAPANVRPPMTKGGP